MDGNINNRLHGANRKITMGVKDMPRPPYERGYEKPPHEEIFERLDRIEEILRRVEEKLR